MEEEPLDVLPASSEQTRFALPALGMAREDPLPISRSVWRGEPAKT